VVAAAADATRHHREVEPQLPGAFMGRQSKQGVLKRQRERKKAEKAALKREKRLIDVEDEPKDTGGDRTATQADLEALGIFPAGGDDPEP